MVLREPKKKCKYPCYELARNLVKMLRKSVLKVTTDKTMRFYKKLNPSLEKIEFACITEETVKKLLCCLNVSKTPEMDEVSPRFLEDGAESLEKPFCYINNLSIKLSTLPDKCIIAKLTPLIKKGSQADPIISMLPFISKLIEKTIHI